MRVAVIIPTYKEAGAIGALLEELAGVFRAAPGHEWYVVVVDANSPDGTAELVRGKSAHYPNLRLIIEPEKRGIALAYVEGMRYAIDELGADVLVEFDGDGQHDPRDVARLVHTLEEGYDYAVGSRYVAGGSVPRQWALYRKILSRFGSLYARLLLELPVYDATSGLKATRVAALARALPLAPERLLSRQYAYKLQFMYEAALAGARIKEVPIQFRMREHDVSKSTSRDIIESLRVTLLLRLRTLHRWRLLRVAVIGAVGFALQTAVFGLLGIYFAVVRASTAVVIGGELAILSNFFLNEQFSFKDRRAYAGAFWRRIARFHLVSVGSIFIQWLFVRGVEFFVGYAPLALWAAFVAGVALGLLVNYAGYYFWVWGERCNAPRSSSVL